MMPQQFEQPKALSSVPLLPLALTAPPVSSFTSVLGKASEVQRAVLVLALEVD